MTHHKSAPAWVVIVIGAIVTGAGLLWSSTIYDDHGEAILDGPTATVLVALLGVVGTILGLLLQRTGEVRHQVKNTHTENLRDDLDGKHTTVIRAVEGIASDLRGVRRDIGRNSDEIAYMRRRVDALARDIDDLEETINPKETP